MKEKLTELRKLIANCEVEGYYGNILDVKDALNKLTEIEQLRIGGVSQQRELLAFLDILEKLPRVQIPYDMKMDAIKQYQKANCG